MVSTNSTRLAIIGCGYIAEVSTILALRRIGWLPTVLVDTSPKRIDIIARKSASNARSIIRSADFRLVLNDFDAAVVALPHSLHGPIGTELAAAGKHVFMEKPLAVSEVECTAMIAASDRTGAVLSVGLLRRYLRVARWTKALLDSGTLGEIKQFSAKEGLALESDTGSLALLNRNLAGGGVFLDTGAHTLDLLVWWLGNLEPVSYRDDSEGGVEADCILECRLPSGGSGLVELSRTRDLRNSVRIEGSHGFVEVHLSKNEIIDGSPNALAFKIDGVGISDMKPQFFSELFDAELADFRTSVSGEKRVGVSGTEGAKSVKFIERCYAIRQPLTLGWTRPKTTTDCEQDPRLPRGSKVLVTGATGFIGGRLAERLLMEQGAQVRCIIRNIGRATRLARLPVEIVRADLSNAHDIDRAVEGMDYVFHCAYDVRSRIQNVEGLRNLIDACAKHKVRRLVHVSTFAVYAPFADGPLTEEAPDGDRSAIYTNLKLELETSILNYARDRGVPSAIVQPTIVYGPFCKPWTNAVAEMLIHGDVILPDRGEGLCNAIYVDDLTNGLVLSAVSEAAVGNRFILSGPEPITWAVFFSEFARALKVNPPRFLPREQISKSDEGIVGSVTRILSDPRRIIKTVVSWNPAREVLQKGLDAMPGPLKSIVMNYYFGGGGRVVGQTYIPDKQALSLYSSKATADCSKAYLKMGYRPRFDFETGMALTSQYLDWAFEDIRLAAESERSRRLSNQKMTSAQAK